MVRVRRWSPGPVLGLIGLAAVLVGCGGPAEPERPGSPLPPRTVSFDVRGLDPCSGMPPEEAERLRFSSVRGFTAHVDGVDSPACTWVVMGDESFSYSAQTIPSGAESAVGEAGSQIVDVDGFAAVQGGPDTNNGPGLPPFCQLAVDVADGQTLRIQVSYMDLDLGGDPVAFDSTCAEARRFTSAYLATIRR